MNIIDIRPFKGLEKRVIDYKDNQVIFAQKLEVSGAYYYSLCCYNENTKDIKEYYRYRIHKDAFMNQCTFVFGSTLLTIKMEIPEQVDIDVYDTGSSTLRNHTHRVTGTPQSNPLVINDKLIIIYTETEDETPYMYLVDLGDDAIYPICDKHFVDGANVFHGFISKLPTYNYADTQYLIYNEMHMEVWEQEDVYDMVQNNELPHIEIKVKESLNVITLDEFVQSIKQKDPSIPFTKITERYVDGWCRYLWQDDTAIYYRDKDFATQIESITKVNKATLEKHSVYSLDHNKKAGELYYENGSIFEVIPDDDYATIIGHYGFTDTVDFRINGDLIHQLLDNRYILTSHWTEGDNDIYYDYIKITDILDNTYVQYRGYSEILGDTIVLYDFEDDE